MNLKTIRILIGVLVGVTAAAAVFGVVVFQKDDETASPSVSPSKRNQTREQVEERTVATDVTSPTSTSSGTRADDPQIGVNFIRVLTEQEERGRGSRGAGRSSGSTTSDDITQPAWIFEDFSNLGVQVYRQMTEGDLLWQNVEPTNNSWEFSASDAVLSNTQFEPVVTLFSMQYASGTPPWATSPTQFEPELGTEAKAYLDAVLGRYASSVKYWEIGNEMDHWRAADPTPSGTPGPGASSLPSYAPTSGYSPKEQGVFLAQAAAYIRSKDPDAIIVLPGMAGLDSYATDTWLTGVVEGGGKDFFDIMNYHYYGSWEKYVSGRTRLARVLEQLGISDKPVWLTETGVTSDASFTQRTNYPNSSVEQAADVVRRIVLAYASGDDLVLWHTHVSSTDEGSGNDWRAYGLLTSLGAKKTAWYTYQLLAKELIPFSDVTVIKDGSNGSYLYRFTQSDGSEVVVGWGTGIYVLDGADWEMTEMVKDDGNYSFVSAGESVTLTDIPVLIRRQN